MKFSSSLNFGDKLVGAGHRCFVIGEAGVAHFGDYGKALQLIDLAAESGADAVKFQVFDVGAMISKESGDWKNRMGSRSLSYGEFEKLKDYANSCDIIFFATAHDERSFEFLVQLDVPMYKLGSGEITNWGYIDRVASHEKPVILSTGMSSISDIESAVKIFEKHNNPKLALLHCVTSYPTNPSDVSLKSMRLIAEQYGTVTGYSDHTIGFHIPLAAVALGADIIEKHIALEFNVPDAQDWKVSCGKTNFGEFISQLRDVEQSLGRYERKPTPSEVMNMQWALKSLVLARDIKAGMVITEDVLTTKRPGTGISPNQIDKIIGKTVLEDQEKDTVLRWENIR